MSRFGDVTSNLLANNPQRASAVVSLALARAELFTLVRDGEAVDDDFLSTEQYIASGLVTIEFVKYMLEHRVKLPILNSMISELSEYLTDTAKRDIVIAHLQGALTFSTVYLNDFHVFARHYKHFVLTLGRDRLCEWMDLCGHQYAFQAITGGLTHMPEKPHTDLLEVVQYHSDVLKTILAAYQAGPAQGSNPILQFFYLNCFDIVRHPDLVSCVIKRLGNVKDVGGYVELCKSLTVFLLHDVGSLDAKLDTIVEFINSNQRDLSLPMYFGDYISRYTLAQSPGLWPDFIFYPFTVSKKNPLIEGKIKGFVFDFLYSYVDESNWQYRKTYIGSKLIYELHTTDKLRTIHAVIRNEKEVNEYIKDTLSYLVQHKPKKLSSYAELVCQCYRASPALDPTMYIGFLRPPMARSMDELFSLVQDRRNGSDSLDAQALRAVVIDHGDKALVELETILSKCKKNNSPLTDAGRQTLKSLTALYTDQSLRLAQKMIQAQLLSNMKEQFLTVALSDEALLSDQISLLYQMSIAPKKNKMQAKELMDHVVSNDVYSRGDDVCASYPYSKLENKKFIAGLSKDAAKIRLSPNEVVYDVSSEIVSMDKNKRIEHHFTVAKNILEQCGLSVPCGTLQDLLNAYRHISANRRDHTDVVMRDFNLALQIQSIKKLQQATTDIQTYKFITIYKELDPRNICMMGDRVDGSCLSFDSGIGNNRSVFTNALECNKGVFYIKDEYNKVIGRFIVALTKDSKIVHFPTYYKGYTGMDLGYYVKEYLAELSQKMSMPLGGKSSDVELLFCDDWYCDYEYLVDE